MPLDLLFFTERQGQLLEAVVARMIDTGQPPEMKS